MFVSTLFATCISVKTVASERESLGNTSRRFFLQEPAIKPRTNKPVIHLSFLVSIYSFLLNYLLRLELDIKSKIVYGLNRVIPTTHICVFRINIVKLCKCYQILTGCEYS